MDLPAVEALGLLEIDGLPRAVRAQDAALKRAPVRVLACAPVSGGKVVLALGGEVAVVEEALAAADLVAGSARLDRLWLPGIHPEVLAAVGGARLARGEQALALFELRTVASAILAADAARKVAEVRLGRLHLAAGYGGRAYFLLYGELPDLEAAAEAARAAGGERLADLEIIAAPHPELEQALLVRPWGLDPAREYDGTDRG
jgi:microcompartment protein CcmL/EutN